VNNSNNGSQVRFGFVKFFNPSENFGFLRVKGESQDVWFNLDSQRVVVDGLKFPRFSKEQPKESPMPQSGSQVVVAISVGYELLTPEGHRILRRKVSVTGWNFAFAWNDCEKHIAACSRELKQEEAKPPPTPTPAVVAKADDPTELDKELEELAKSIDDATKTMRRGQRRSHAELVTA